MSGSTKVRVLMWGTLLVMTILFLAGVAYLAAQG